MKAIFDLGKWKGNAFTTIYSSWDICSFDKKEDAILYAKGIVCGLEHELKTAAVQIRFSNGKHEIVISRF